MQPLLDGSDRSLKTYAHDMAAEGSKTLLPDRASASLHLATIGQIQRQLHSFVVGQRAIYPKPGTGAGKIQSTRSFLSAAGNQRNGNVSADTMVFSTVEPIDKRSEMHELLLKQEG